MLETLKEREREEVMGIGDLLGLEYMNAVSWTDRKLKNGYNIEKLFVYPEDGEDKLIWCPGEVIKVKKRDDKKVIALIKWDKNYIGSGKAESR
mmetsp:Transcript_1128/g.1980  ORF Transcript_1128/g.1980 Transcript_1128/m.1980 type:complete len:93 (+) Transcript_1128:600-878(+)